MIGIFLGKPIHWALGGVVIALLMVLGSVHAHVRWFGGFILLLFAVGLAVLLTVLVTSRPGEAITRDPLDDDAPAPQPEPSRSAAP